MKIKPITLDKQTTLNLNHPSLIEVNEWSDAQNMVRALDGLWENRKGVRSFDNAVGSGKKVDSLHFWKPSAGAERYLTVSSGGALYSYAEGSEYNNGTFTSRQTGFVDGQPFEFAQYADVLIGTNGLDAMYTTTNNISWTIRNGANTRRARYILFVNDTGYVADIRNFASAFMTGGTSATSVIGTWNVVTDGSFTITIDGVVRNITGLNFSAAADMAAVAAIIQVGIRTATGSTETCVWSTNKFIITSASYAYTSQVSVTSATGSGTDISGVGATAFMDAETGRGTATAITVDRSAVFYGATVPANPWEFANTVDIESDNGQIITGLTNLGALVLPTKEKSVYIVNIATPNREQIDYGAGCLSHRSIVKAENSVYIASEEGAFTVAQRQGTTGSVAATPLSSPIQPLWDLLRNKTLLNGIYFPRTRSIYWAVQTTTQNFVLVFNVQWRSWSYFVGVNALDWTIYEDDEGIQHLLYADGSMDKVRELETDRDDDDSPIDSVLATGSLNFDTDELKNINWIEITGFGSNGFELDYELYFDEETISTKSGTIDGDNFASTGATASSAGPLASGSLASGGLAGAVIAQSDLEVKFWVKRIPLERTFRTIQVKLRNSQEGVRWRFKSMNFSVEQTGKEFTPSYIFN